MSEAKQMSNKLNKINMNIQWRETEFQYMLLENCSLLSSHLRKNTNQWCHAEEAKGTIAEIVNILLHTL